MERLTRPNVSVVVATGKYIGPEVRVKDVGDKLLELILNGPTLNSVNKDVLRHLIRQLYDALKDYEDTGLTPEQIVVMKAELEDMQYRHDRVQDFCVHVCDQLDEARGISYAE